MNGRLISEDYFNWLIDIVNGNSFSNNHSYHKLLHYLHEQTFIFEHPMDENRAIDGMDLRYRYGKELVLLLKDKPCSILEMMVALCVRCEETIMVDVSYGDRTSKWFWTMIGNLNLADMDDNNFNIRFINHRLKIFLTRQYMKNGQGGLFTVKRTNEDIRNLEIWYQMCAYLNEII